jgi:hypothetical protein
MKRKPVHAPPEMEIRERIDPETPVLDAIDNELIGINVDKWFKKSYPLDFGLAHIEISSVLEEINCAIQRTAIYVYDSKADAERLESAKLLKLRQEWSTLYQDKMTVETLKAVLAQDEEILAAWHRHHVLKGYLARFENMMENLRLKLGAMRSFEATRRKIIDDDPR